MSIEMLAVGLGQFGEKRFKRTLTGEQLRPDPPVCQMNTPAISRFDPNAHPAPHRCPADLAGYGSGGFIDTDQVT